MPLTLGAILCLAALVCAGYAKGRSLLIYANIFVGFWALYALNWTGAAPRLLLDGIGFPITEADLWAFTDALLGLFALVVYLPHLFQRSAWPGWALWATFIVQEIMHAMYSHGLYAWVTYTSALNSVFLMQITVFIMAGGRGVLNEIRRAFDAGARSSASRAAMEKAS